MPRLLLPALTLLLAGCPERPDIQGPPGEDAVVVYWTVTSLGTRTAGDVGLCDLLKEAAREHGTTVTCLRGAIPPSSSTAESHVRTLYPAHMVGPERAANRPGCDADSLPGAIARAWGQDVLLAFDTPGFSDRACQGETSWLAGSGGSWLSVGEPSQVALVDEAQRPVSLALDALLERTGQGDGVVAVLNDFEAGGARPRCWFDPYAAPCDALWRFGQQQGLVEVDDDRRAAWLHDALWDGLVLAFEDLPEVERRPLREQLWGTVTHGSEHFVHARFLVRLERLLAGLDDQGRLGDLVLVVVGDHGENPCVADAITGEINCEHGGLPNEWSARVPAYVFPATVGERWVAADLVGGPAVPWSTVNLSHGLLDALEVEHPASWPEAERAGAATSWACGPTTRGLRVAGKVSLRCAGAQCGAWEWGTPEDLEWLPEAVDEIPPEVAEYAGGGLNWFERACSVD